jgi:hypothetical protein
MRVMSMTPADRDSTALLKSRICNAPRFRPTTPSRPSPTERGGPELLMALELKSELIEARNRHSDGGSERHGGRWHAWSHYFEPPTPRI